MTASAAEDKGRGSCDKKMKGDDDLRTLECLRGRLLAERQSSRVAKEDAELLDSKLVELEKKLKEETKLRKKAEKRLNFLMKKLESLKISPTLLEQQSSSSDNYSGFSCSSTSSTCTLPSKESEPEESDDHSKSQTVTSIVSQDIKEDNGIPGTNASEESSSNQDLSDANSDKTPGDMPPDKDAIVSNPSSEDSKEQRSSSSLEDSAVVEMESNAERTESETEDHKVDNSMALVPVNMTAPETNKKSSNELKVVNKSVIEVLDALRHARENIQSSMERRRRGQYMISVGPT